MITLIILLTCIFAGFMLRNKKITLPPSRFVTVLVWLLLFFFGISIGSNRSIVENFDHFGFQAVTLALMTTFGSALAAFVLFRISRKNKSDER